jgi:4-hydroxy-2-oxoheptanedioate aldolase
MDELPRLNGMIRAFDENRTVFGAFATPDVETSVAFSTSNYDGIIFEMEHNPWDIRLLRDCFQYMLNRRQIFEGTSVSPEVVPLVRIPPNGDEKNQWLAKQALDLGAYGIVWPHISTVDQAHNAVSACRYPRLKTAHSYEPAGVRGDAPAAAARYWGLTQQEYYRKADVWPLNPAGEILVVLMIEDTLGVTNLPEILRNIPGIGLILIGEGDLSQELGCPRQYDHPALRDAMSQVLGICKKFDVPVGHPHVDSNNVERVIDEGYRCLIAAPTRNYAALEKGRQITNRL